MAHCTEQNAVEMGLKSHESIKELWRCENNDATHVILNHSVHTYEVTECTERTTVGAGIK